MRNLTFKPGRHLGLLLVWLVCQSTASAADFKVIRGETRLVEGTYFLDVYVDYVFSEVALEALDNGVPLTLDVHIRIQRTEAWIWEQREVDQHLRFRIRYHALAQLYQVVNLSTNRQQNFVTRDAAITALGEILSVPLAKESDLNPGEEYLIKARATLDIEALPLPLRPLAYLSPSWNLSTKWHTWQLQP